MCIHEDKIADLTGDPISRQIEANNIWREHTKSKCYSTPKCIICGANCLGKYKLIRNKDAPPQLEEDIVNPLCKKCHTELRKGLDDTNRT